MVEMPQMNNEMATSDEFNMPMNENDLYIDQEHLNLRRGRSGC